ncbi:MULTISPECIES: hypothetical protein [unclassified Streptomyces]|uniref:hypothetical protein n=1 Tax=unclassified Streptomyces TaxID=2593676 RepID=UPI0038102E56
MSALTTDDILAASAYLEAVWTENAEAKAALLDRGPDETTMPVLVTDLGNHIIQGLMLQAVGIHDGMGEDELEAATERLNTDPTVRVSKLLAETMSEIAPSANEQQCETLARSVISYVMSVSADVDQEDVLPLIAMLRDNALRSAAEG